MQRWAQIATPIAIASPFVTVLVVCTVFIVWFGISTAHNVEIAAVQRQAERIASIGSYLQHIVDDTVLNARSMEAALSGEGTVSDAQLETLQRRVRGNGGLHSSSHIRYLALLNEQGDVISRTSSVSDLSSVKFPQIVEQMRNAETAFRPLPSPAHDLSELPDFLYVRKLKGGPAAYIAVAMSPLALGRSTNFKVTRLDGDLAMIDLESHTVAAFGGEFLDRKEVAHQIPILARDVAKSRTGNKCEGHTAIDRSCVAYGGLDNSSLLLAGFVPAEELRNEWVRQSRPLWVFGCLLLIGGMSSSACIGVWVRQRRRNRQSLAQALNDVKAAYEAKSNFMAHMSHELRTPLNSIIGFSDVMRSEIFGPMNERYQSYAQDIHFSASHLHRIVSEMMDLERLEKGHLPAHTIDADLNLVAADAVRVLSILALEKKVDLTLNPWTTAAIARIDPHRAAQIAINLISNAIKYSEPGDKVTVSVDHTRNGSFALVIADEGIGMTAEEIAYTRRPFGQPAYKRTSRHDSVGLGLPIVRGFLATIGGELIITSEKGKGTTVSAIFGPGSAAAPA